MPFRVSGKNIAIGDALRGRVNQRIAEATAKYFDGGYSGHVTIGKDGFGFRTECVVHLDSGIVLEAEAMAGDAYSSADQAAERIEKRLRRYKGRLKDHQNARTDGGQAPDSAVAAPSYVIAAPEQDTDEEITEFNPVIIAEIDDGAQTHVGERCCHATRHDRHCGSRVSARWTRSRQSGLSPRRRSYRLDRSAFNRGEGRPLTARVRLLMVRRLWQGCQCGGSEVRDSVAASSNCGLLNLGHTGN